jgi:hypothetical protein
MMSDKRKFEVHVRFLVMIEEKALFPRKGEAGLSAARDCVEKRASVLREIEGRRLERWNVRWLYVQR